MDRRFLTVLGVSLLFALVVSSVFYQFTRGGGGGAAKPATDMKDLVVAARPLQVGTMIKAEDLKVIKFPASAFPKEGFSTPQAVIDRAVVAMILPEEPILNGRLAVPGSGVGLAPVIPVGMRAVTVRVSDVAGVAGFVLPGTRVDVLVTGRLTSYVKGKAPDADTSITSTVLQNVIVLSTGQTLQNDNKNVALSASTVTLLATPDQAEILTLANTEGRIQLILRNGSDQKIESTRTADLSDLVVGRFRGPKALGPGDEQPKPRRAPRPVMAVAPPPVAAPAPPPPAPEVVVFRGTQRTVEQVKQN
jgi:pilus assembly protein CpaB